MAGRYLSSTKQNYRAQGAAAFDMQREEQAQQPVRLPDEQEAPVHIRRVRARLHISPFSVLGVVVTVFLAVLVIFSYVRLYEADSAVSDLEQQLTELQKQQKRLESSYESRFDLAEVEEEAAALGMTKPKSSQTVYVNLNSADRAEITPAEKTNIFVILYQAIRDSIAGFVEYLS